MGRKNTSVCLMHDNRETTAGNLPRLIGDIGEMPSVELVGDGRVER